MTADIRAAAQRRKFASIEEMMNDPGQRGTEVKVAHRYGYWMIDSGDEIDTDEIAEADAYLEAHIQHRISEARVTPTREQLIDVLRKHQHDYCEECHMSHGCTCGWHHAEGALSTDDYDGEDPVGSISEHQAEVLLALLAGLAEGES